jgi:hypothetical protein
MNERTAEASAADETLDRVREWVAAESGMTIDAEDRISVDGPPTPCSRRPSTRATSP